MGLCNAFGPQIREGCDHPMVAGADACYCAECGVVCKSKFEGCRDVWLGAKPVPKNFVERPAAAPAKANRTGNNGTPAPLDAPKSESSSSSPQAPGQAAADLAVEAVRGLESSLGSLRADFEQLAETVSRLQSSHLHSATTVDGLRTSMNDMERERQTAAKRTAAFEADTLKALHRNKDALSTLAGQINKLETPNRAGAEPNLPSQGQQSKPSAQTAERGRPDQSRSTSPPPRPTSPPPRPTSPPPRPMSAPPVAPSDPARPDGGVTPAEPPAPS
ncbi:MAG TPA: hypothetical protein VNB24_08130 [Acidimicrobiales bacterium]|nr:hypothetical protein [Acidimicrobiales bacterium]